MKTLVALLILAGLVFAEPTSNFEVKQIDPETLKTLELANIAVDSDLKAFEQAQQNLASSRTMRDRIIAAAKQAAGGEYEGQCQSSGWYGSSTGGGYTAPAPKQFRRIEIRGKYALVTTGTESCVSSGITLTTIQN